MADEQLEENNVPPDILLAFRKNNQTVYEYLPRKSLLPFAVDSYLHHKYISFLQFVGRPLYYWHLRFFFAPEDRKREDLQFIWHVFRDHDGEPADKREYKYLMKMYKFYQPEISHILVDIMQHENIDAKPHDHYIEAYRRKWLRGHKTEPEFKRLYHGITTQEEYMQMLMIIQRKIRGRWNQDKALVRRLQKKEELAKKKKEQKSS